MARVGPSWLRRARVGAFVLCAIARDEDDYLDEWIGFHLGLGFDRIVIYDHGSATPIGPRARARWGAAVEVRRWRPPPAKAPQGLAYADALRRHGPGAEWMLFLDLDEFLNLKRHRSVAAFAADYAAFDAVALNWRVFGSAGLAAPDGRGVLDRFTRAAPADFEPNAHVKTLFRPRSVLRAGVHSPWLREGARLVNTRGRRLDPTPEALRPDPGYEAAQVNHYFTKSRAEFAAKLARGRADVPPTSPERFRGAELFDVYDRNEEEDLSILRHLSTPAAAFA